MTVFSGILTHSMGVFDHVTKNTPPKPSKYLKTHHVTPILRAPDSVGIPRGVRIGARSMSVFFGVRSTKVGTWKTPAEYGVFNSASARNFGARSTSQNGAERRGVHFRTPYSENLLRVHPYAVRFCVLIKLRVSARRSGENE